jgi:branched-chain amino acid transport system substrate-binding protein
MEHSVKRFTVVLVAFCFILCFSNASAEEFLVGSHVPLTGPTARSGIAQHEGIMVAKELFNQQNPKYKITVLTVDDEGSPAKAVAGVEKLAYKDNVLAISGGYGSNVIGPASDAANKAGLVYMTGGGVSDHLVARGYKTFFRVNNKLGYSKAMVGLYTEMGIKSLSILYITREVTTDIAKDVKNSIGEKGVEVFMHPFDPGTTDFKPLINKVKLQDKSEAILMSCYENDYIGIIRACKVLKPPTVKAILGFWALATATMWKEFSDLMPNVYGTTPVPYPPEYRTDEGKNFVGMYKKLFNKSPEDDVVFGYVQAQILFDSIAQAHNKGTLAKGGLIDELRKVKRDTLLGLVEIDEKGDNPGFSHTIAQHQNGKIVIVWPEKSVTGKKVFPGVPW